MGLLDGTRALVTGASSGLGQAMAEALLAEGATVAAAARPGPRLSELTRRWQEQELDALELALDVRDPESVARAARRIESSWGSLDLLVNNAGIGMRTVNSRFLSEPQPFWQVSPEGFSDVIATNLTGYFLVARAFAPLLVRQRSGAIVNVSMNHETMRRRGFVPYGPSRAGAESLSAIMTEDLREHGVAVNMLLPGGATLTGMIPDELATATRETLLQPSIMGPPIVYLASPLAAGVTGERIVASEWQQWLAARAPRG